MAALFDTPLPGSDIGGFSFRTYDKDHDLLVAGNASALYVVKTNGAFVGRIALPPGPAAEPVVDGGRLYLLSTNRVIAYQIAPFSDVPVAQSPPVFVGAPSLSFSARVTTVRRADGRTLVYGAGPGLQRSYTIAVFDSSLNVLAAAARLRDVETTSLAVAADSTGHPYVAYRWGRRRETTVLDGLSLGPVQKANLFPHGIPDPVRLEPIAQPWTFAVPDGALYVAEHSIARADTADAARLVFTSCDFYRCETSVRLVVAASGGDRAMPSFRRQVLRFGPAPGTMSETRLTLPGIDPRNRVRPTCAPYILVGPDGMTAVFFLSHAQPPGMSCQGWTMPAPQPRRDWLSYWAAEFQAAHFPTTAPGAYVETIGDDDWKLYRLACEGLESGAAMKDPPAPIWTVG